MASMTQINNGRRDGFIAARKAQLSESIAADRADSEPLREMLRLLGALLHHEAHERLEGLKSLYYPLDPDAPPATRDVSPAGFERFEAAFVETLKRANYSEIDADTVQSRRATKQLTGLSIKPSAAGIRRVRFFARGVRPEEIEHKSWLGLRKQIVHAEVMNDVVVLVGFKNADEIGPDESKAFARMRRGMRPGAALVKHFRNVATPELVTLHPGARPSMRPRDQVFLAAPAVATGVPVLLNIWPAITVLFAVLAAYFGAQGAIEENELKRAVAAISGLVAVGAFVMRQRLKYEAQTLRYQKQLADTVYFRNLANNAGVLDLLVGAGEDQDAKEAFLAYGILLAAEHPMVKGEIDNAAEAYLADRFDLEVDFEINDALAKIERLGLVTREGETYRALPPADALLKLDAAWDSVFNFSTRR